MPWPDDESLPVEVYAAFGADLTAPPVTWNFTDLTARYKQLARAISIRRPGSDNAGEVSTSTGTVDLGNDDGQLTPQHGGSDYFPYVDMNTPVMLAVGRIVPKIDGDAWSTNSTNSLGSSDGGRPWLTISAGAPVLTADYQASGGVATLSVPIANAYRSAYIALNAADVDVAVTVSAAVTVAGGAIEPGNLMLRIQDITHYYLCRISVAVGGVITASINANGGSGELVSGVVSGVAWSSGVALRMRAQAWGTWIRMRVWRASDPEPTTWALTVVDDQITAAGGVGFRSGVAGGNSNTKPVVFSHDNFTATELPAIRMDGYADSWKPTYLPTTDGTFISSIQIMSSGILRRITQGESPKFSPLYRTYSTVSPPPILWYPMEAGRDVDTVSSGLPGQPPLEVIPKQAGTQIGDGNFGGTIIYGVESPGTGAASLISLLNGGRLSANIPASTATSWTFEFVVRFTAGTNPSNFDSLPMTLHYNDQWEWTIFFSSTNQSINCVGGSVDGAINGASLAGAMNPWDGQLHHVRLDVEQVGSGSEHYLWLDGEVVASDTWTGFLAPVPNRMLINYYLDSGTWAPSLGHPAFFAPRAEYYDTTRPGATRAWIGEEAAARIERLCGEERISVFVDPGSSEPLGIQPIAGFAELLKSAVKADMGILSEYMWGLRYRPRSRRTNLTAAMTVDLSKYKYPKGVDPATVLLPVLDDQGFRNDWTVSRVEGGSARVADQNHIDRYGQYTDSAELAVRDDTRLAYHAGWRTHLGTWPGMRYPDMQVDLHANPDLIEQWMALSAGDRVDRTNPPAQHPPGPISQVIGGYSETLSPKAWTGTLPGLPYGPWEVAVAGGTRRYTASDSALGAGGLTQSGTSFLLTSTTKSGLWVQGDSVSRPATFPLAMTIGGPGGEDLMVSGISGTTSPQTATVASGGRGLNGIQKAWSQGVKVNVRDRAITPL